MECNLSKGRGLLTQGGAHDAGQSGRSLVFHLFSIHLYSNVCVSLILQLLLMFACEHGSKLVFARSCLRLLAFASFCWSFHSRTFASICLHLLLCLRLLALACICLHSLAYACICLILREFTFAYLCLHELA